MKRIKQNAAGKVKKAYSKPELTVYGTINQITESTANGPVADGGKGQTSMGS